MGPVNGDNAEHFGVARNLLFLATVFLSAGCWVNIKTPLVAQYDRLDSMSLSDADKDSIELALGTPQGVGVHRLGERELSLTFYQGLIGRMSMGGSLQADYGLALVSYEGPKVDQILYARSSRSDPAVPMRGHLPVVALASNLTLGTSSIDDAVRLLGYRAFGGRRVDNKNKVEHDILWYNHSESPLSSGRMKERVVMLGYDKEEIVQDLMWFSSFPEDMKNLGEIDALQFNELSKLSFNLWINYELLGFTTDASAVDAVRVYALLRSQPKKLDTIVEVLGLPTARGMKCFKFQEPLLLAAWASIKSEMMGRELISTPDPRAPNGQRTTSFSVISMPQNRLIVSHTPNGDIVEIMWFAGVSEP